MKIRTLVSFFVLGILNLSLAFAQSLTAVSGNMVDTDGITWANGTYTVSFVPNPLQQNPQLYVWDGTKIYGSSYYSQSGNLNSSGAFSFNLPYTSQITPAGSSWVIQVCPNASAQCGTYVFTALSPTLSLSAALTAAIPAPRFKPLSGSYGYADVEAITPLALASTYFNVSSLCQKIYNGSAFVCSSGGLPVNNPTATGTLTAPVSVLTGSGLASTLESTNVVTTFSKASLYPAVPRGHDITYSALCCGWDNTGTGSGEPNYTALNITTYGNTLGLLYSLHASQIDFSPGDSIPVIMGSYGVGVAAAQNEGLDFHLNLAEIGNISGGTLNASGLTCSSATCTISLTATQGYNWNGPGALGSFSDGLGLIDSNQTYTTGSVTSGPSSSATMPGLGATTLGTTSTNFDSVYGDSVAVTTTTSGLTNSGGYSFPMTNATISLSSLTGVVVSSTTLACIGDAEDIRFQCFHVTAKSGSSGAGTITADYINYPFVSGAGFAQGGMTGGMFSITGDCQNSNNDRGILIAGDVTIQQPLCPTYPVMFNSSGNSVSLYTGSFGSYNLTTRMNFSYSGAGAYTFYPVTTWVYQAMNPSTLKTDGSSMLTGPVYNPLGATISTGDTWLQPHAVANKIEGLRLDESATINTPSYSGQVLSVSGVFSGPNAQLVQYSNPNSSTVYRGLPSLLVNPSAGYNNLATGSGLQFYGPFNCDICTSIPPYGSNSGYGNSVIAVTNSNGTNWNANFGLVAVNNNYAGEDGLFYNPSTYSWQLTSEATGSGGLSAACVFTFAPTGLAQSGASCSGGSTYYTVNQSSAAQAIQLGATALTSNYLVAGNAGNAHPNWVFQYNTSSGNWTNSSLSFDASYDALFSACGTVTTAGTTGTCYQNFDILSNSSNVTSHYTYGITLPALTSSNYNATLPNCTSGCNIAAYATGDSPTAIPVFGSNGFMVPSTAAQVVAAIGAIPITSIGSAGLSGTSPIVVASTGAISCPTCSTGGGSGTVTSFSSGNLSPLFTTSVATSTTTPVQSFTLSNAAQNSVLAGPATGGAGVPSYQTAPTISAANMTSFPTFNQNTTGNAATATSLAGTPSLCSTGQAPTGILASGNATGCAAIGGSMTWPSAAGFALYSGSSSWSASPLTLVSSVVTSTDQISAPSYVATGTTPGTFSLDAGTGSISALPANSAGFAAPVSGGTAYLIKLPATITAGIPHYAAPATGDGVNESALTVSAINLANSDVTGILPATVGGTGTTSLTGLRYANGGSADTAATSAQVQGVIGGSVYDAAGAAATAVAGVMSGSAASLNAASALPNGTTATTQAALDNTTDIATDAFVQTAIGLPTIKGGIIGGYAGTNSLVGNVLAGVVNGAPNGGNVTTISPSFSYSIYGPAVYQYGSNTSGGVLTAQWYSRVFPANSVTSAQGTLSITSASSGATGAFSNALFSQMAGQWVGLLLEGLSPSTNVGAIGGYAWNIAGVNAQPLTSYVGTGYLNASATGYFGPSSQSAATPQTTEALAGMVIPYASTASRLCVYTSGTQNAGGSLVITLRVNGASPGSGPTVTVAAGAAAGFYCDMTDTASITADQYVDYQAVNNYAGSSAGIYEITAELAPTGAETATIFFPIAQNTFTSGDYFPPYGYSSALSTEANARGPLPRAGTLNNFSCLYTANAGTNPSVVTLLDNGSSTGLTVTIPTSGSVPAVVTDSTHTYNASALDAIDIKVLQGSGTTPTVSGCSVGFN